MRPCPPARPMKMPGYCPSPSSPGAAGIT